MTTIADGNAGTDTNTASTVAATVALQDGVAARKLAGKTVGYPRVKPRSTDASLTFMRDVPTTIIRMSLGGSSFGGQSLRLMVP